MIAALYALAAAMVIGGSAAVIQGFPYVRLESGLALVIAGSVAASSGAVLFGLGVVAAGLRRVERSAGRVEAGHTAVLPSAPPSEERPRLPSVLPPAPVPAVAPPYEPPAPPERSWREHEPPVAEPVSAVLHEPEPELPIPGLTPAPPAPDREPEPVAQPPAEPQPAMGAEDDLFAAPGDGGTPATLNLRRGLDAAPDPEPDGEAAETSKAAPHGVVVGRYASGGNTYLMFENGSIEAETPQGRFTFASLDELKAFVDAGGESGTRGAA